VYAGKVHSFVPRYAGYITTRFYVIMRVKSSKGCHFERGGPDGVVQVEVLRCFVSTLAITDVDEEEEEEEEDSPRR